MTGPPLSAVPAVPQRTGIRYWAWRAWCAFDDLRISAWTATHRGELRIERRLEELEDQQHELIKLTTQVAGHLADLMQMYAGDRRGGGG